MAREDEVRIDCAKVRKLLLGDCRLTRAGAEARMNISHGVLHRMLGGSRLAGRPWATVKRDNAQEVVRLAQKILGLGPAELPLESLLISGETDDRAGPVAASASVVTDQPIVLPYASLGALFKGREVFVRELRDLLQSAPAGAGAIVSNALLGMGGVGKTRTAVEYAWTYRDHYAALLFVQADSPDTMDANLAALCGPLRLPEQVATEAPVRLFAVLSWLRQTPGWLLILDNVDTEAAREAVSSLMGVLAGGHILLTSRFSSGLARGLATKSLDLLAPEDAQAFLLEATATTRKGETGDADEALVLAEALGRLALALELAAATIEYRRCSLAEYGRLWREARDLVKGWNKRELTGYHHAVAETWAVSIAQVSPEARTLLERLAFLAPDPIPSFLLDVPAPNVAPSDMREALIELVHVSLAAHDPEKDLISVHRLIQDATRRSLSETDQGRRLAETLGWVNAAFDGDPANVRSWPRLEPLAPHVERIALMAEAADIAEPTTRLMGNLGLMLATKAQFAPAEALQRRALAIDESSMGSDHPAVAFRLNNLAMILHDTNRLNEVEPLLRRALAIMEARFGAGHIALGNTLTNLGVLMSELHRFDEAERFMREALFIYEENLGPESPMVALALNNLATMGAPVHRVADAEALLRRAVALDEVVHGPDHPATGNALNNLAACLRDDQQGEEARRHMRRVVAIFELHYGVEHPSFATALNNLAEMLQEDDQVEEAEALFRRAIDIDERALGQGHRTVGVYLSNLSHLLQTTGRMEEAEAVLRRAIKIGEGTFGAESVRLLPRLDALSKLLRIAGRRSDAEEVMRRALAIEETHRGDDDSEVAIRLTELALLLLSTNRLEDAEALMRRSILIMLDQRDQARPADGQRDPMMELYAEFLTKVGHGPEQIEHAIALAYREADEKSDQPD